MLFRAYFSCLCMLLPTHGVAAAESLSDNDAAAPIDVQLNIHESRHHYDVAADDLEQLLVQLRVPAYVSKGDIHANGLTTTELRMMRETGQMGGQCWIEQVRLELSITITTPRWSRDKPVPESLARDWPHIRQLIEAHEDGHRQNTLNAARWLRDKIKELRGRLPCSTLSMSLSRYMAAAQTRRGLQDGLLDSRAAARQELVPTIRRVRIKGHRPDWMQ